MVFFFSIKYYISIENEKKKVIVSNFQGDKEKAIKELSKLVHRHPAQASPWLTLALMLIRLKNEKFSQAAVNCASRAMKLGRGQMDVTKVLCLVSLASISSGDLKAGLRAAQSAIHTYPDVVEAWAVLVAALKKIQSGQTVNYHLRDKIVFVRDNLRPSLSLRSWLEEQSSGIECY